MLKRKMADLKQQKKKFEATKCIWMRDAQDTIRRVEESLRCTSSWNADTEIARPNPPDL